MVEKGFQTSDDAPGSSTREQYHRSGAGIELKFATGVTGSLDDIAIAVLKTCPVPMMVNISFQLLIVLLSNRQRNGH